MRGRATWAAGVIRKQAKDTTVLRRANRLNLPAVLAANTSAGATTLTFKSATSSLLTGAVVSGAQFTLASHTYTVAADSGQASGGVLTVAITPALVADAALGAPIVWTLTYTDTTYQQLVRSVQDLDIKTVSDGHQVRIVPFDPAKPAPRVNDLLGGVAIFQVDPISGDDGVSSFMCHIETGAPAS